MSDDILTLLYNACNPLKPATPEYYVDCSDVRGSNALTKQFTNELVRTNEFLCFLFSGHIGSGKSSELEHLRHTLETCRPTPPHKRYFPVLLDAGEYLDDYDVTPTDILLAIVAELAAALRKVGIKLEDGYFRRRLNEIKQFFLSDVEIEEGEIPLWEAKVKIKRLQKDPTAREEVRKILLPQTSSLLLEINTVFERARLELKKIKPKDGQPYHDFVLILDNLEKIQRIAEHEEGEPSQRALFIERAPQLTSLQAHVVFTVPLRLVRAHGPQLERIYGVAPFVLPMIKVEERGTHAPYEPGRKRLEEILQKRAGETPLEQVFTLEALDWLLTYCGGDVRELMGFVQQACTLGSDIPIPLKTAQQSLRRTIGLYSTSVKPTHWEKMAQLERSPDQRIDNSDPDYQEMLEEVSILEYMNGSEGEDVFSEAMPWYAVNPIVRRLPPFKAAHAVLDNEDEAEGNQNDA